MMYMSVPRYWAERIQRYRLIGSRCLKCGKIYYPPRLRCLCGSREFKEYQLPRRGKLISFTTIRSAPEEYKEFEPYSVGLIELEDGTKIIAQLTDVDADELKVGMEVEAVFRKIMEYGERGIILYGIKFRPALSHTSR